MTSENRHGDFRPASAEASSPMTTADSHASNTVEKMSTLDGLAEEAGDPAGERKKPLSFYLAFSCLLIMVLLCAMDSTIMAVSIPVSHSPPSTGVHCEHQCNGKLTEGRPSPKSWAGPHSRPSGPTSP